MGKDKKGKHKDKEHRSRKHSGSSASSRGSSRSSSRSPKRCKKKHCHQKFEEAQKKIEELSCRIKELERNKHCSNCHCDHLQGQTQSRWLAASHGQIPGNAVHVAPDHVVARGRVEHGSIVPGKLYPQHQVCWVAWNNSEVALEHYEVLVDTPCQWVVHVSHNPLPAKAIRGGNIGLQDLYIGRATIDGVLVSGYVLSSTRELLHSNNFKNERKTSYEILVHM